ncbi:hypothetical protein N665_0352s0001 [Sinapis alba]|nr:hypothetical protein N665_0352s0001 [Sinapis alba]
MNSALSPRIFFAHSFTSLRSPRFAATTSTCWRFINGSSWETTKALGNSDRDESPHRGTDESFFDHVDAEVTPETVDFFVSDAEGDPDCPTQGYSSIELALQSLRQGKVCS